LSSKISFIHQIPADGDDTELAWAPILGFVYRGSILLKATADFHLSTTLFGPCCGVSAITPVNPTEQAHNGELDDPC
jgi:hypothetical protein